MEQVKEEIQKHVMEYQLTLKVRGGGTEIITAEMLGLTYVDDKGVERADGRPERLCVDVFSGDRQEL